jgi:hypothetical protein
MGQIHPPATGAKPTSKERDTIVPNWLVSTFSEKLVAPESGKLRSLASTWPEKPVARMRGWFQNMAWKLSKNPSRRWRQALGLGLDAPVAIGQGIDEELFKRLNGGEDGCWVFTRNKQDD